MLSAPQCSVSILQQTHVCLQRRNISAQCIMSGGRGNAAEATLPLRQQMLTWALNSSARPSCLKITVFEKNY